MYTIHKPENCRLKNKETSSSSSGSTHNATMSPSAKKLQLQSKLKDVLCTNLFISADDADTLLKQAWEKE